MRVLFCFAFLSSLFCRTCVQGQTMPTTAPEDYRLTIRSPSDCAPSECSYFAGVQTNEGDSAFLDFYLEANAEGWVAIGVSESPDMFSADVLGCNVLSADGTVVVVDTWNLESTTRFNQRDTTTDGLVAHNSSNTDGRISCSFSRSIAVMDAGQDLNLNGDYFVLYGTDGMSDSSAQAPSAASGLAMHSIAQLPAVSAMTMNLVTDEDAPPAPPVVIVPPLPPTRAPEDSRLILSNPEGCTPSTCNLFVGISTNEDNSSFFDFYIEGDANGWVAVGFSESQNMFNADVLGCNVISGTTTVDVVDTWNPNARTNSADGNQDGVVTHSSSFINGRISCSFSRFAGIFSTEAGPDLDLADGEYFIMFGVGQNPASAVGSALLSHRPQSNPSLTSALINVLRLGVVPTPPTTAPEDYRLTIRSPSDCAPSECSYFAGVQTNEGDSAFLDFYLEANAEGWVAIGVSESPDMFSADVLGCNVLSADGTVVVVDTWNLESTTRFNQRDTTTDGLVAHNSSNTDGRISCSFSRSIAVMDAGQDLNLNGDYFVLYGTDGMSDSSAQAPSAASGLAMHSIAQLPAVSAMTMNLVTDEDAPPAPPVVIVPPLPPTRAPEDSRLILSNPEGCTPSTCNLFVGISTNEDNSSFFDFYIEGDANGWVAVGFSESQNMFNADVLGCNVISGTTTVDVVDTWNPNARTNSADGNQDGVVTHSSSFINGRISCSFSRFAGIFSTEAGPDLDLADGEYFIMFGVGQNPASAVGSALLSHRPQSNPSLTSALINVLRLGVVPTPPTTAPEDYRLTIRSPSDCAPSECSYFAGVQTNEGDPTFLDFYLEGAAMGWVAIGVSETPSMFSADVLGCTVLAADGTVVVVDTWNTDNEPRNNQRDTTDDGLITHIASNTDGRISCSFSRSIAAMDAGQDLNLNGDYFVLYGTHSGPAFAARPGLSAHSIAQPPAVSSMTMNLVTDDNAAPAPPVVIVPPLPPTRTPEDSRLMVSIPEGCNISSVCNLFVGISTNEDNSSFFDFYIEGDANGWVAVGFSESRNMFNADVLGCNVIAGTTTVDVVDTWNPSSRTNSADGNQAGVVTYSSSFIDGRISCNFSRFAGILSTEAGPDLDLASGDYFIMFGVGQNPASAAGSALLSHRPQSNPSLTDDPINVLLEGGPVGGGIAGISDRQRLIRAHGILMIIAWPVLAVTAIFFAAWMKPALPNGEWFQVHRAFMIASLFVGALGFLLIFVAYQDAEQPGLITFTDNPTGTAHFVIGIIIMALHIANPLIAIFRCKPDGEHRWIFNLLHASTIGLLVELLALTNIGLGTNIFGSQFSQFGDDTIFWVYIGYLIFFLVLTVGLFILFTVLALTGDSEDRAKTAPSLLKPLLTHNTGSATIQQGVELTQPGAPPAKDEPPKRKPASQDAPIRWVALCVFLSVMLPMMITLIVLIALDP